MNVVPLPSDRWTTMMFWFGRLTPGFYAWRAESFQFVIVPR